MSFEGILKCIDIFGHAMELYKLPVIWNPRIQKIQRVKSQIKLIPFRLFCIFCLIIPLGCLSIVATSFYGTNSTLPNLGPLTITILTFQFNTSVFISIMNYSFIFKRKEYTQLFKQIMFLYGDRQFVQSKPTRPPRRSIFTLKYWKSLNRLGLIMHCVVIASSGLPFGGFLFPHMFPKADPVAFFLRVTLHMHLKVIYIRLLSSLVHGFALFHGSVIMGFAFQATLFYLMLTSDILSTMIESHKKPKSIQQRLKNRVVFRSNVMTYKQLRLLNVVANICAYHVLPGTMAFVIIAIGSVMIFMTIKAIGKVPWEIYGMFPSTLFMILVTCAILLPEFANVREKSIDCLSVIKYSCIPIVYDKACTKVSMSLPLLGAALGPYGVFDKEMQTTIISTMVSVGINLLMSFDIHH